MGIEQNLYKWWNDNGCPSSHPARSMLKGNNSFKHRDVEFLLPQFRGGYYPSEDDSLLTMGKENVRNRKLKQKAEDTNRIERKTFREYVRIENSLEEYNKALIEALTKLKPITIKHESINNKAVGVIQISDTHLNELIDIEGNKFDFNIASKRFKLLAERAKQYFKTVNISNILLAFTGDIINNDVLLDKLLNEATNRSKATMLAFYIIEQFIIDLNKDYNITIAGVSGNEGRKKIELGFSEILTSDNYDYTILNMLKIAFRNSKGIAFNEGNSSEQVINIAGSNILILHGLSLKTEIEKSVQQLIGKYATKNIIIDYVFIGHIHSCRIGDIYCRSSSMCGANAYSDYGLNLASRASQNIAIFYSNKTHDVFKIDLQNTDEIDGYDIIDELIAYNAKSIDKIKSSTVIFQVIV